jgi:nucleotide-binding universal stress UspA family protein
LPKLKTVLVAVDSSELAWSVVEMLDHLQLDPECLVILAHIVPPPPLEESVEADVPHSEPQSLQDIQTWLDELSEKIDYRIATEVVTGDPADEIVRLATINRVDLVVIGSRGLRGLNRILQGSVSSQVVADAPCSVLVVKP